MNELTFLVKGSAAEPYEVAFIKDDLSLSLTAVCSCPAGQFGNFCKHRISILDGKTNDITSNNATDVSKVVSWLNGTDVESALAELRVAEKTTASAKKALDAAKKKLARAMNS